MAESTRADDKNEAENQAVDETGAKTLERVEEKKRTRGGVKLIRSFLATYWKIIFALIWPIFLAPFVLIYNISEVRCAYVVLLMAGYWVTECLPLAITSLIPIVLFPAFGVSSTAEVCACYMNDAIMVFIGGFILAVAIEHSNLHLRIALVVMKTLGCSHAKLLGGLCAVTTFVSMWVTNTAATAMMVPIIFAVLRELEQAGLGRVFETDDLTNSQDQENSERPERLERAGRQQEELVPTNVTKAYLLGVAYCATFGGTGTLVGTGTNLTFKGIYENTFPDAEDIDFGRWMVACFPQMFLNSFLTWFYLRVAYMGYLRPSSKEARLVRIGAEGETIANRAIQESYRNLGPITFHELGVATLFLLCVFLWIFRKPGFVRGWAEALTDTDIKDSVPVMLVSILMFFIPKEPSFIYSCSQDSSKKPIRSSEGLITWNVIESKMPWGLMFLLGGGFAISRGSNASGLAKTIGNSLVPLRQLPPIVVLALVCLFVGIITEFTSNVGTANIVLPIVAQMSIAMEIHPIYLMLPTTLMCSFSFRLPVGTPPNAIAILAGHIPTKCLMAAGCIPSIYSLCAQLIFFPTWGTFVYDVKGFPEWAINAQPRNEILQPNPLIFP